MDTQTQFETMPQPLKLCIKCKTLKPRNQFWKETASKDGLYSYCIDCGKASDAKRKKRCPKCGRMKNKKEFSLNRSTKDGLQSHCTNMP